jgi:hypothetical protein
MTKKPKTLTALITVVCVVFFVSCKHQPVIVPVREAEFRAEYSLPLDDAEIKDAVGFIARGGVSGDQGFIDELQTGPYKSLLMLFEDEANLTVKSFRALGSLRTFFDPSKPVYDVIDARESRGAYQNNRMAYRLKDFWIVLLVDKLKDDSGQYIRDDDKKFARIIIMKALDAKKAEK